MLNKLFAAVSMIFVVFIHGWAYADSAKIRNPDNDHGYQRIDTPMTWSNAKAHCESLGAYLSTLTSQEENDFVYNNLCKVDYVTWLGGTDEVVEGDWQWITGEPWEYTNWYPGQPDDCWAGQDYLIFWFIHPNSWDDTGLPNDDYENCFICEWDNFFEPCEGDFDGDGDVDGSDLAIFAADFGRTDCPLPTTKDDIDEVNVLKKKIKLLKAKIVAKDKEIDALKGN